MSLPRRSLLCLFVVIPLLLAGCAKKLDPATTVTRFFEQIGKGEVSKAYESTTFAFQAQQNRGGFEQAAKEMGLTEFTSATWEPPAVAEGSAKVRGEVVTKIGKTIPLVITLNEEGGQWRIFSMKSPRDVKTGRVEHHFSLVGKGAAFKDALSQPMPADKVIHDMARETLILFNEDVQQKSFSEFYKNVSSAWQRQLTEGQLQRAFQPFVDREVDIAEVKDLKAVFTPPPHISTDGLLIVAGEYPTEPFKVGFTLKFIYELPKWRLFGLDVNLQKRPPEAVQPAPEK